MRAQGVKVMLQGCRSPTGASNERTGIHMGTMATKITWWRQRKLSESTRTIRWIKRNRKKAGFDPRTGRAACQQRRRRQMLSDEHGIHRRDQRVNKALLPSLPIGILIEFRLH